MSYLKLKIEILDDNSEITTLESFVVTKAKIKESLEAIFEINLEGYIETIYKDIFYPIKQNNKVIYPLLFNPNHIKNSIAKLEINNPYNTQKKIIDFNQRNSKIYTGVISGVDYLGYKNNTSLSKVLKSANVRHYFSLNITSTLFLLSLNKSNRIYTNTSILDVIKEILKKYATVIYKELDFSLLPSVLTKQDIITQYQESDLEFITRLCFNNGIYFYEDENKIYFQTDSVYHKQTDIKDQYKKEESRSIIFNSNTNNNLNEPCISSITRHKRLVSNTFSISYSDFNNPSNVAYQTIFKDALFDDTENKNKYHIHNFDGQSSLLDTADIKSQLHLEQLRANIADSIYMATSNIYNLILGSDISIENNQITKDNQFMIIGMEQTLINNDGINGEETYINQDMQELLTYTNTLTLIPKYLPFTPNTKAKPMPPNLTQGIVIGEGYLKATTMKEANESIKNEENTIYTDSLDRVKVRLNAFIDTGDLYRIQEQEMQKYTRNKDLSNDDDAASFKNMHTHTAFIRVLSPIASNGGGFFGIPRVGDEVLISYLDGDIDKPIITGSLYNNTNKHINPEKYHQTSISSRTLGSQEKGVNEITLSNLKNDEEISIKAEKNYSQEIKNNFEEKVHKNKNSTINGSQVESILKYHRQTVGGLKDVRVGGEYLTNVALSKDTQVGLSNTLNIGASNKLRVANDSSEYIGGDKDVKIVGNLNTNIENDETRHIYGNKIDKANKHFSIHSNENLHLSANDELALTSQNNLLLFTKQSLGLKSDENLTINANNIYMIGKKELECYIDDNFTLSIGESSIISISKDEIVFKVKDTELTINKNGITSNKKLQIK